ncbi:MAG: response regulator transcription factor [Meiothermus sp.]|nr:response regulator transcription factor [Meiothermus sp.]
MKLLVLEDEPEIREALVAALQDVGYAVESAGTAREAEGLVLGFSFDALLFDVSLPEGVRAGFELVGRLRSSGVSTPVLYLTGRDALEDIVAGLDSGGDDYILKPFRFPEVLARLRAQLRRSRPSQEPELRTRDLCIQWATGKVSKGGAEVHLTGKEYAILELLASSPGRLFTRNEIFERVWESSFDSASNIVEVYINLVRGKLGDWVIENIRGRGYRFPEG